MSSAPGWWRENRWWLPALPLAVAAMLVASAFHVKAYWWDTGLHHESAVADQGHAVSVTQGYSDYLGPTTRTYDVKLTGLDQAAESVTAHLEWAAEPDQALRGCQVALIDSSGRRYEIVGTLAADSCTPDGQGGPHVPFAEGQERGTIPAGEEPRPSEWSTDPAFLVPEGVEITQVLVWWQLPDYVRLNVA